MEENCVSSVSLTIGHVILGYLGTQDLRVEEPGREYQ